MAMLVHATEPVDQPTWEIQKDSFAPPPTRRIVRGWDRAPVSARAPRLQGQKVWKKGGLKAATIDDTRNEAQEELEKEGTGARKKSRMLNVRENINDAMWAEAVPDAYERDIGITLDHVGELSEKVETPAATAREGSQEEIETPLSHIDDAKIGTNPDSAAVILQSIPRKRTNTDHVITPKKPLRQTTRDYKEQSPSVNEKPKSIAPTTTRPRRSLRKSMSVVISDSASDPNTSIGQTRLSSDAAHLQRNDVAAGGDNEPEAPAGDSINKRRVSRRSIITTRRSIAHPEQKSDIEHIALQSIEFSPQDAPESIVSTSANSSTRADVFTSSRPGEYTGAGDMAACDIIGSETTLPSESTPGFKQSASNRTRTYEGQIIDAIEPKLPEISVNCVENVEQLQITNAGMDIPNSTRTGHDQWADVSESQQSLSELQNTAGLSMSKEQVVVCQDTNTTDGGPRVDRIISPTNTEITNSSESRDGVPLTENTVSLQTLAELDVHQDIQNVEVPEVPDSANLATTYDHDDTDMLRNFLTRVKANKAAKNPPKRKRSLPHSPLRIPLGDLDNNASPSPLQRQKVNELNVLDPSPSKRKKKSSPLAQCENEPEPRRSGRTKPPTKELPGAPSFIPVRRLGQDIDTTVNLKRNEEKELAALTRVNTRKNKGNALTALEVLAKKSEEKEDPGMRQRLLKEVFDEKMERGRQDKEKKGREKKSVAWAEELAQFQILIKFKSKESNDDKENEKVAVVQSGEDKKQSAVRVGVRTKAALGMALNGTPAPKRKMRGRV